MESDCCGAYSDCSDDIDICQCSSDETNRKAFELIENLIDAHDIFDADQEYTNFELTLD